MGRANFIPVSQVPYFDDVVVNDVDAVIQVEGVINEVETRPQVTPVS